MKLELKKNQQISGLMPQERIVKIRCGVIIGHIAVLIIPLAVATVISWIMPAEERVTVMLYDPELDNVVENPSPDPDPANPVPPSGTPDAGEPTPPDPEPEPTPEPETQVNENLPPALTAPRVVKLKQPKLRPRKKPMVKPKPKPRAKPKPRTKPKPRRRSDPADRIADIKPLDSTSTRSGSGSRRGSNSEEGHNAPGGERDNSRYGIQVSMMIKRMWVTPEEARLGGRTARVLIKLRIAPNGRVLEKQIITKSGILAMDQSVAALLDTLQVVPRPFDGKSHTLTFWMKAD